MARFIKVPLFDIYDEDTDTWAGEDQWWTEGELVYLSDINDTLVTVPDNFQTDLASIPRWPPFFRAALLQNGHHRPAAVVHDYLCRQAKSRADRKLADRIFLEAMLLRGVTRWKAKAMYAAVRLAGSLKRYPK